MSLPRISRVLPGLCIATALLATPAAAIAAPKVVATIKPIHSLVAGVMAGVGTPELLIAGASSPHGYSLKPSQAASLQDADVVFWVGEGLETSLARPIGSMAEKAIKVELADTPGIDLVKLREGHGFEAHDHAHEGEDHDEDAAEHEDHAGHDHESGMDMHIWLDPENARFMVREIAKKLGEVDAEHASAYLANATDMEAKLDDLVTNTEKRLKPLQDKTFVVFHDAYHYFEDRFGVFAAAAINLNPEVPAGADRVAQIHALIQEHKAACVFTEPQFEPKLVNVVVEGSGARTAVLDPLGADLEDGPNLYFQLIGNMAKSMADCLSGS